MCVCGVADLGVALLSIFPLTSYFRHGVVSGLLLLRYRCCGFEAGVRRNRLEIDRMQIRGFLAIFIACFNK